MYVLIKLWSIKIINVSVRVILYMMNSNRNVYVRIKLIKKKLNKIFDNILF
jgi:hypothetical protein